MQGNPTKAGAGRPATRPRDYHEEASQVWIDYYRALTDMEDKPHFEDGCLFHWIAQYAPVTQTDILHICYEAGYETGLEAARSA